MRKVALLIETDRSYGRGLLHGIARWSHLHGPWSFFVEPGSIRTTLPKLEEWGCDGIIARTTTQRLAREVAGLGLPAIVLDYECAPNQVRIGTISQAEGRLAAEHLLDRGFHNFAYCGFPGLVNTQRQEGFEERLSEAGFKFQTYQRPWVRKELWWGIQQRHMAEWLTALPKPVGVFACNDDQGRRILEACRADRLAVPDDVAVVAVDNDELLCELCNPPLSSIALNTEKAGFEAAVTLDRMMNGKKPGRKEIIVEPTGVVTRQSTNILAMDDREVALAVRFIREHAGEAIHVEDVLRAVPMSRRSLESRFRQVLGRSPNAEILRAHVERAKMLLATTSMAMPWIAEHSGFATPDYMAYVFHRALGMKPLQYRKHYRGI